jgi:Spy/CpxP family protein refolding chaperone
MLMPIVWHSAVELRLTPSQESSLLKWRNDQMHKWVASRHQVMRDNLALRKALLDGKPENALNALVAAVHKDQARMLDTGIDQVEYLHRLLTPKQWKQLIALYRFRMMKGGWDPQFMRR